MKGTDVMNRLIHQEKSQGKALVWIIILIVVLTLCGAGSFFAYRYHQKTLTQNALAPQEDQSFNEVKPSEEKQSIESKRRPEKTPPVFENIGEFIINLDQDSNGLSSYILQSNIQVQLYSEEDRKEILPYQPKIKAYILKLLASKKYSELNSAEGKEKLAKEIGSAIEQAVGKEHIVYEVLFTSFIMQPQ
jgi:flagellar FliL protein